MRPLGPTHVKGISEPINVHEVVGFGPLRTRLQRSAGRGLSKFVGRTKEKETLKRAAARAQSGAGQIVEVVAEPGIGKSRLFFEFKAEVQSEWTVLEAFSVSHGKGLAYLPIVGLLHSYFEFASEDSVPERRGRSRAKSELLIPTWRADSLTCMLCSRSRRTTIVSRAWTRNCGRLGPWTLRRLALDQMN